MIYMSGIDEFVAVIRRFYDGLIKGSSLWLVLVIFLILPVVTSTLLVIFGVGFIAAANMFLVFSLVAIFEIIIIVFIASNKKSASAIDSDLSGFMNSLLYSVLLSVFIVVFSILSLVFAGLFNIIINGFFDWVLYTLILNNIPTLLILVKQLFGSLGIKPIKTKSKTEG